MNQCPCKHLPLFSMHGTPQCPSCLFVSRLKCSTHWSLTMTAGSRVGMRKSTVAAVSVSLHEWSIQLVFVSAAAFFVFFMVHTWTTLIFIPDAATLSSNNGFFFHRKNLAFLVLQNVWKYFWGHSWAEFDPFSRWRLCDFYWLVSEVDPCVFFNFGVLGLLIVCDTNSILSRQLLIQSRFWRLIIHGADPFSILATCPSCAGHLWPFDPLPARWVVCGFVTGCCNELYDGKILGLWFRQGSTGDMYKFLLCSSICRNTKLDITWW